MTDLRTAAQQALEALEWSWGGEPMGTLERDAITALRAALAQQAEPVEPPKPAPLKRGTTGRCTRKVCECEKEGLGPECIHLEPVIDGYPLWSGIPKAEPVEPVAWVRLEAWKSGKDWPDDCFTALPAEGLTPLCKCADTPLQRKPLTEEEIAAEWQKASECASKSEGAVTTSQFVQMFARAIERALGIGEEK